MKCKIGNVLMDKLKFPVWISNPYDDMLNFEIGIYCKSDMVDAVWNHNFLEEFYHRPVAKNQTALYKTMHRAEIKNAFMTIEDNIHSQIDFKKLDDFFLKIDKKFVVERLVK